MSVGENVGCNTGENTGTTSKLNTSSPSATLTGGDLYPAILEDVLKSADSSLIITISNDTLITDIELPIDYRGTILDLAVSDQTANLDNFLNLSYLTNNTGVVRTNDTTLTITFNTNATNFYELFGINEEVGIYIPAGMLVNSDIDLYAGSFTVIAQHYVAINATILIQPTGLITVV